MLRRRWAYPAACAAAAAVAGLGLAALRSLTDARGSLSIAAVTHDLTANLATYLYVIAVPLGLLVTMGRRTDRLQVESLTDDLTGLANRRQMERRMTDEIARSTRSGARLAIVLVDLDHLKEINDQQGHRAGDRALQNVAAALKGTCRRTDTVGRIGGDEFLIIAPDTSDGEALELSSRIDGTLRELGRLSDMPRLTVSQGISELWTCRPTRADVLFSRADQALYEAKRRGRAQAVVAPPMNAGPVEIASESATPIPRSRRYATPPYPFRSAEPSAEPDDVHFPAMRLATVGTEGRGKRHGGTR
jgi:diguanylate cyclase (GGDEF)-like protein